MSSTTDRIDIWVDCDPGIDDAVMLACVAASSDRLQPHGVSSVAGNLPSDVVTKNVLRLADFLGLPQVPLARGAVRPLVRPAQDAAAVHGAMGLGEVVLPVSTRALEPEPAVVAMQRAIAALPEGRRMTLVPTGPLTNIALLLRVYPQVADRIDRIVLMGGSTVGGNVTPYAEFNVWGDPEAAAMVLGSGLPIVMCGLDVTLKCGLTREQLRGLLEDENPRRAMLGRMLSFYTPVDAEWRYGVCVIHDAATILYLTNPELFSGVTCDIEVDCGDGRRGETRVVPGGDVLRLNDVDMAGFQEALLGQLARL